MVQPKQKSQLQLKLTKAKCRTHNNIVLNCCNLWKETLNNIDKEAPGRQKKFPYPYHEKQTDLRLFLLRKKIKKKSPVITKISHFG